MLTGTCLLRGALNRSTAIWVSQIRFAQMAQESTRLDYLHEVEHMRERVLRLEKAIVEAVKLASPALQEVITDLQALRGIAHISAVTIAAEFGQGFSLCRCSRADGLLRSRAKREFQWQADSKRQHYEDG
jgi:hypothetical protein